MTVEMASTPELPNNWAWTGLGEIGEVNLGKTPRKTQYTNGGGLKIVKFRDIVGDSIYWDENDKGFVVDSESLIAQLCELHKGDVLVTASAHSSEHIGKKVVYVSTIPQRYSKVFFVGELLCVRVNEDGINPRIVYYYLLSQDGYKAIQDHVRGVHLISSEARQIPLPLPPLPEQHRIVARIEKLFTRLDAGVEALKKTKAQLKCYRQAVLKSAFEGKLTEEWSQAHKDELKPASVLLERIKQERHKTAKGKYKELPPLDTSDLPELPEGWVWTRLIDFAEIILGQSPPSSAYNENGKGLPFYQGKLEFGAIYPTAQKWCTAPKKIAEKGDVLISVRAPVGPTNICPGKSCIGRGLAAVRGLDGTSPLLILYLLRAYENEIANKGTGTTFNAITGDHLKCFVVPLPPLPEQHRIVSEIERRFSMADEIEKTVDHSLKQAARLRHSILKRALEGRLVPQDLNDEPVGKLLERIREQRANQIAEKRVAISKVKQKQSTDGN